MMCDRPGGLDPRGAPPATIQDAVDRILDQCKVVLFEKRRQRGTENITRQGLSGVVRRFIEDKYARLARAGDDLDFAKLAIARPHLVAVSPADVEAMTRSAREALREEAIDVINYSIILLLLERGWWELPEYDTMPFGFAVREPTL